MNAIAEGRKVFHSPGGKIIEHGDFGPVVIQGVTEMAANESRPSGDADLAVAVASERIVGGHGIPRGFGRPRRDERGGRTWYDAIRVEVRGLRRRM